MGEEKGPDLSGEFHGPVAVNGGDAVDLRGSQGVVYKAENVVQNFWGQSNPATPQIPFQVPLLPGSYIKRSESLEALKSRVLECKFAHGHDSLSVTAVHGLGGIGKSTLVAALAHDQDVQEQFRDGILWVTSGQQPEVLPLLSGWIQSLNDFSFRATTESVASAHLRTLLKNKAVLLVVDDVWEPKHLEPFLVGGSGCSVVITTRRMEVVDYVGANLCQLGVMTPSQSFDLLAKRSGCPPNLEEVEITHAVATFLGHLPLALELVAVRVAHGMSWSELFAALQKQTEMLDALVSSKTQRRKSRLEVAFGLSLNILRSEYTKAWDSFVWLGVLPEDVTISAPMAANLWGFSGSDASEMLEVLWGEALLSRSASLEINGIVWPTYRLHDLLHHLACRILGVSDPEGLGLSIPEANAVLLERYRARTTDGMWHTLLDDGYILTHLTWHMERVGWIDEIHALLKEETPEGRNGWYETLAGYGFMSAFIFDVNRAWSLSEECCMPSAREQVARNIGLQIRYALIISSLNSLSRSIPPSLLRVLASLKYWSVEQSLAFARQVPWSWQRLIALVEVAATCTVERQDLIAGEILGQLDLVEDEEWQVSIMLGLLPLLSTSRLSEVRARAKSMRNPRHSLQVIARLLPRLEKEDRGALISEVLTLIREQQDVHVTIQAKLSILGFVPDSERVSLRDSSLSDLRRLPKDLRCTQLWISLLPCLSENQRQSVVDQIFSLENGYEQFKAAFLLISTYPELVNASFWDRLWFGISLIQDEFWRASALTDLVPYLPDNRLTEILQFARRLTHKDLKSSLLAVLSLRLHNPESRLVLEEALNTAMRIGDLPAIESMMESVMLALIPHLPASDFQSVLEKAMALSEDPEDISNRYQSLLRILPFLSASDQSRIIQKALTKTLSISERALRLQTLLALRSYVPIDPSGMIREIRCVPWLHDRWKLWVSLLPDLKDAERDFVINEMDAALHAIKDEFSRVQFRIEMLPHLHGPALATAIQESLNIVRKHPDQHAKSGLLLKLTERLLELGLETEAVATLNTIEDSRYKQNALVLLISKKATDGDWQDAVDLLDCIELDEWKAEALCALLAAAPTRFWVALYDAGQRIHEAYYRSRVLARYITQIARLGEVDRAVELFSFVSGNRSKVEALSSIASVVVDKSPGELYSVWLRLFSSFARQVDRESFLKQFFAASPIIGRLCDEQALATIRDSVESVIRWWP